ncbi:MAG: THUMP-like domain-containing protein [Phycisphaerae bacterium]
MSEPDTLRDMEFLLTSAGQEALAGHWPADPLAAVVQMRKTLEPWQASVVMTLRAIRSRARSSPRTARFPDWLIEGMVADEALSQQASSYRIGAYKAGRLAELGAGSVVDLCCGMGVDSIALARRSLQVSAVDIDPAALLATRHHAALAEVADRLRTCCADAGEFDSTGAWLHIDPQRRSGGRRGFDPHQYRPDLQTVQRIAAASLGGVVKLAPGDAAEAMQGWPVETAWQHVSEAGVCKQLLGWWSAATGSLPARSAVVVAGPIEQPTSELLAISNQPAAAGPVGRLLFEPDPAVTAAGGIDSLARKFDLHRPWPEVFLLSGDRPIETALAAGFEVLAQCPGREKDLARQLKGLDAGLVEIKPVGLQLDTDRLQRKFRGSGRRRVAVFWIRIGRSQQCCLCHRLGPHGHRSS